MTDHLVHLVTTPIYYVNDRPHIGHAYTTIACDAYARWLRKDPSNIALFSTGTDEHGLKVQQAAAARNIPPQDFVDEVSQHFIDILPKINASPNNFIRTTEDRHKRAVHILWKRLEQRDYIYLGVYSGWYAVKDEAYYAENETEIVNGVRKSVATGAEVQWFEEPCYFFRLKALQGKLLEFLEANPGFIQPKSRRNEVLSVVRAGLDDLCISRRNVTWGIQVPNDPDQTIYVWIDALTNYLTAAGYPAPWWEKLLVTHVVGKDILRFHAIYWPAILIAAGYQPPHKIVAHGWWTTRSTKIGKSSGNAVNIEALIERYGVDAVRYFLLREIPFGDDGEFSEEAIVNRYNTELANNLGNLLNRALNLVHRDFNGRIPNVTIEDWRRSLVHQSIVNSEQEFSSLKFRDAIEHLNLLAGEANRIFTNEKSWSNDVLIDDRAHTLHYVLWTIVQIANGLLPVIPVSAQKILDLCGAVDGQINYGTILPERSVVFPRLEFSK